MTSTLHTITLVARYTIAALFALSCLVALVYWAVRRGKIKAFGAVARMTRSVAEPVIRPLERRVVRWGGNPQNAPMWLAGIILVAGLIFLSLLSWVVGQVQVVVALSRGGPRGWISFVVSTVYFVLTASILVRVLGSWFGIGRYNRWMRYAYRLTDWIVEPIRRMIPGFGFLDFSPLIALVVLWLVRGMLATWLGV